MIKNNVYRHNSNIYNTIAFVLYICSLLNNLISSFMVSYIINNYVASCIKTIIHHLFINQHWKLMNFFFLTFWVLYLMSHTLFSFELWYISELFCHTFNMQLYKERWKWKTILFDSEGIKCRMLSWMPTRPLYLK